MPDVPSTGIALVHEYSQAPSGRVHRVNFLSSRTARLMGIGLKFPVTACYKEVTHAWSPTFTEVPGWAKRCKRCFR